MHGEVNRLQSLYRIEDMSGDEWREDWREDWREEDAAWTPHTYRVDDVYAGTHLSMFGECFKIPDEPEVRLHFHRWLLQNYQYQRHSGGVPATICEHPNPAAFLLALDIDLQGNAEPYTQQLLEELLLAFAEALKATDLQMPSDGLRLTAFSAHGANARRNGEPKTSWHFYSNVVGSQSDHEAMVYKLRKSLNEESRMAEDLGMGTTLEDWCVKLHSSNRSMNTLDGKAPCENGLRMPYCDKRLRVGRGCEGRPLLPVGQWLYVDDESGQQLQLVRQVGNNSNDGLFWLSAGSLRPLESTSALAQVVRELQEVQALPIYVEEFPVTAHALGCNAIPTSPPGLSRIQQAKLETLRVAVGRGLPCAALWTPLRAYQRTVLDLILSDHTVAHARASDLCARTAVPNVALNLERDISIDLLTELHRERHWTASGSTFKQVWPPTVGSEKHGVFAAARATSSTADPQVGEQQPTSWSFDAVLKGFQFNTPQAAYNSLYCSFPMLLHLPWSLRCCPEVRPVVVGSALTHVFCGTAYADVDVIFIFSKPAEQFRRLRGVCAYCRTRQDVRLRMSNGSKYCVRCCLAEAVDECLKGLIAGFERVLKNYVVAFTRHCVTLVANDQPPCQFVFFLHSSISELLTIADIQCTQACFDGKHFWGTPQFVSSIASGQLRVGGPFSASMARYVYPQRLLKYAERGFALLQPGQRDPDDHLEAYEAQLRNMVGDCSLCPSNWAYRGLARLQKQLQDGVPRNAEESFPSYCLDIQAVQDSLKSGAFGRGGCGVRPDRQTTPNDPSTWQITISYRNFLEEFHPRSCFLLHRDWGRWFKPVRDANFWRAWWMMPPNPVNRLEYNLSSIGSKGVVGQNISLEPRFEGDPDEFKVSEGALPETWALDRRSGVLSGRIGYSSLWRIHFKVKAETWGLNASEAVISFEVILPPGGDDLTPSQRFARDRLDTHLHRMEGVEVLRVSRDSVYEDSIDDMMLRPAKWMANSLKIEFVGEAGIDEGGLKRDWLQALVQFMFDPDRGYFEHGKDGSGRCWFNRLGAAIDPNVGQHMRFLGNLVGRTLLENQTLDMPLCPAVWWLVLQKTEVDWFQELWHLDREVYRSLGRIAFSTQELGLDRNMASWALGEQGQPRLSDEELSAMDLRMTFEFEQFGEARTVELVPGGSEVPVVCDNAREYLRLWSQQRMRGCVERQIDKFVEGVYDLVPKRALQNLTPPELELLVCGQFRFDFQDFQAHIEFTLAVSDRLSEYFVQAVGMLSDLERSRLLQFATGSSRIPMGGFRSLRPPFTVHLLPFSTEAHLPVAHTCSHTLEVPYYRSAERMAERLRHAISIAADGGFGIA